MKTSADWKTAAISPTCECFASESGRVRTADGKGIRAAGGGWMALCLKHGVKLKRMGSKT
jgi:hypothetical protein